MVFANLLPVILSFGLLAAHYLRDGNVTMVAVALFLPVLLFVQLPWVARLLQLALFIGALEWLRTMTGIVEARQAFGQPYVRTVIILSVVALFTVASAFVFHLPRLRRRYGLEKQ